MSSILFEPLDVRVECKPGENAYEAARRQNVPIASACFGRGNCGLCRVKVISGEASLTPLNAIEKKHLGNTYFVTKLRLSCQLQIAEDGGEVVLAIPDAGKLLGKLQKAPLPR